MMGSMTLRSFGWASMPLLVALVLAVMAQTASAAGTSIHQYRLNEFTGLADDFGDAPLVPIVAVDTDGAGPLGVPGAAGLGSDDVDPVALGLVAAPGCVPGSPGTVTRLCQGYAFGFSQGLTFEGGLGPANRQGRNYAIVIAMLLSDGVGRRRFFDF